MADGEHRPVTSRADAVAGATVRDSAQRDQLIDLVEQEIAVFVAGTPLRVPLDGVPYHLRMSVAEVYRAAGWTVTVTDDQRDGAYMTLR